MMKNSTLHRQQLFVCYLQELLDTKIQQVEYYTHQDKHNLSKGFGHFLTEQLKNTLKQHTALKTLANTLNVHLSGEIYSPVRKLFQDATQVNKYAYAGDDFSNIELTLAQLLQEVKRHEIVVGQGALTFACNSREIQVANTLSEILNKDEQSYLQLRDFVASHHRSGKLLLTQKEVE